MSFRFLHTGDWQLGMTRHFFSEGVHERFAQSRFDATRELGRIAEEENCQFMVVCGDVFESNLVDRKTVSRAFEALKDLPLSVYLLPGNRAQLRAEINAYVVHLYGLSRDDLVYILDTFPVLKKNEKKAFGEFMSRRKCMEEYDRIGKIIVEHEQSGKERAEYGKAILKELSKRLSHEFGKGFDITNLRKMRQFYLLFSK
jgi:predicted MPP superfamily phosphohydrolase